MEKVKIFYNYIEPPKMVRIKSESLCLDYTFNPNSSEKCMNIGDFIALANNPFIDSVQMLFTKENNVYYRDPLADNEKIHLLGWENASMFEDGGDTSKDNFYEDRPHHHLL